MATLSVESGDIVWFSGPFWIELDNPMGKPAILLRQLWAPPCRPTSAAQGLQTGFLWHAGPEKRRTDAHADKPLCMRCRYDGKVCTTGCV